MRRVADPSFRGRVTALWSVTFLGSTPVGGPIVGAVAQHLGPRAGLGLGTAACLAAAVLGLLALPTLPMSRPKKTLADGVLTVTVPKAQKVRPRHIEITQA